MAAYNAAQQKQLTVLQRWTPIIAKLASLRQSDKMGPWYHAFAVLTVGALLDGKKAQQVVLAEHLAKKGRLFRGEGAFDVEKFQIDSVFAAVVQGIDLHGLHRPPRGWPAPARTAGTGARGARPRASATG